MLHKAVDKKHCTVNGEQQCKLVGWKMQHELMWNCILSGLAWGEIANMAKVQNQEIDTQKRGSQKVGMFNNIILSTYFSLVTAWLYWLTRS